MLHSLGTPRTAFILGLVLSGCGLVRLDTTINGKKTSYGGGESSAPAAAPAAMPAQKRTAWAAPGQTPGVRQVNGAHPGAEPAGAHATWGQALPTVEQVREQVKGKAQQEAAYKTLGDYVAFKRLTGVETAGMPPAEQQRHSARETELDAAGDAVRGTKDGQLSPQAQALYDDPAFQLSVVSDVVSPVAANEFQYSRFHQETVARAQASAQQNATNEVLKLVAADKHAGVDRTVFGIELGTAVMLPRCDNEMTDEALLSGVLGGSKGVAQTCFGDAAGDIALGAMQLAAKAAGVTSTQSQVQQVSVKLADTACPDWVRIPGRCTVFVSHVAGVALGATITVTPFSEAEAKIKPQLTKKYGQAPVAGERSRCINTWNGQEVASAQQHVWALPGLSVTYDPLGFGNCQQGMIKIELATLKKFRAAERAAQDANEPKL